MKFKKMIAVAVILLIMAVTAYYSYESRQPLVYQEHLEDVAVSVDGEELTLQDMAFYILYEENLIEQQAMIYHPENTADYWNLHMNGVFIREDAKNTILNMAVHDWILYRLARERNMTLNAEERESLDNTIMDFWMDLLDGQQERIGVSDEYICETMSRIAVAQKFQEYLAKESGHTYASYNWDGFFYEELLTDHEVKVNEKVWERLRVGDISLAHGHPNYINGLDKEED